MNHCGTRQLETKRLILRRYVKSDGPAMYANWASDREVAKFMRWPAHSCPQETQELVENWIGQYEELSYYHWVMVLKEAHIPIGDISVVALQESIAMARIGYCLGRQWWGRGLMAEALQAVMDFLFDVVGVNRVEARHDPRNANSGKVMKKCAMKYEGILRSADRNNLGPCDVCCYGLLRSDRGLG